MGFQLNVREEDVTPQRRQIDATRLHVALLIASFLTCVCFLFLRPDGGSNDFHGHLAYLRHIQSNPLSPFEYTGMESWHPPTYYYLAAISEEVGASVGLRPLKGARVLSILLYLVYLHFGLRTLRLLFQGRVLMCASVLFVVWPSNFEMSTRLNSDLAVIPVYAAVQFYLIRGVVRSNFQDCLRALCISLLGLVFKTSTLVPVTLACFVTMVMLVVGRARDPKFPQSIPTHWRVTLLCVLIVSVSVNCSRLMVYHWHGVKASAHHLGGARPTPLSAAELLAFRPLRLLEVPFHDLSPKRCSTLEWAFKTAIFTEQPWLGKGTFLGRSWVALVLFQLLVTGLYLARRIPSFAHHALSMARRWLYGGPAAIASPADATLGARRYADPELVRWGLLLSLATLPVIALLIFSWRQNWTVCGSYRFVQASLIAWIGVLLLPACTSPAECRDKDIFASLAWLGGFALMTWGIACLFLKIFRPLLGWN